MRTHWLNYYTVVREKRAALTVLSVDLDPQKLIRPKRYGAMLGPSTKLAVLAPPIVE